MRGKYNNMVLSLHVCLITVVPTLGLLSSSTLSSWISPQLNRGVWERPTFLLRAKTNGASVNGDDVVEGGYRDGEGSMSEINTIIQDRRRSELKREMLQLCASFDRGFAATSRARDQASTIISKLATLNPESNAAKGIDGYEGNFDDSPLLGDWRMIWTTAADVLVLGANPVVAPGAIYQSFRPPVVTNIIDFLPRQQAILPTRQLVRGESLLRAKVQTRASSRNNQPMQIGLVFESVELEPIEFLGMDVAFLRPFGFDLPRLPFLSDSNGSNEGGGFFDVVFLDEELLVIRQTSGGIFALSRVDNFNP